MGHVLCQSRTLSAKWHKVKLVCNFCLNELNWISCQKSLKILLMSLPDTKTLKQIWAEVPPDYYYRLNYWQGLWHEWKWLVIKHLALSRSVSPKKILEVGCSSGHLSGLLQELFPRAKVTGIDVYTEAVVEARRRFPQIKFLVADAHRLPFRAGYFDLVICSETIEHVVNPNKVLHEIGRVLKPDGMAIVEMDSGSLLFRTIWFVWTRFGRGRVWKRAHLHPFTANELEQVISGNGLTIRKKMFSHFGMAVSFLISPKN